MMMMMMMMQNVNYYSTVSLVLRSTVFRSVRERRARTARLPLLLQYSEDLRGAHSKRWSFKIRRITIDSGSRTEERGTDEGKDRGKEGEMEIHEIFSRPFPTVRKMPNSFLR